MPTAIPDHAHFAIAARRHRDDALHLEAQNRLPNADHLLGLGVECAIKSVLLSLGIVQSQGIGSIPQFQSNANSKPVKLFHLDKDLPKVALHAVSGRGSARFVAAVSQIDVDYANWRIEDRYLDGLDVTSGVFGQRRSAADSLFTVVQESQMAGALL